MSSANPNANAASSPGKVYEVTAADMPLSCPGKFMTLWNMHPKVYLSFEGKGRASCPYCGAQYQMQAKPAQTL